MLVDIGNEKDFQVIASNLANKANVLRNKRNPKYKRYSEHITKLFQIQRMCNAKKYSKFKDKG